MADSTVTSGSNVLLQHGFEGSESFTSVHSTPRESTPVVETLWRRLARDEHRHHAARTLVRLLRETSKRTPSAR